MALRRDVELAELNGAGVYFVVLHSTIHSWVWHEKKLEPAP